MSDRMIEFYTAFLLGAFAWSLLNLTVLWPLKQESDYERAAQTSCAQYNPTTGDFEWLEEQGE